MNKEQRELLIHEALVRMDRRIMTSKRLFEEGFTYAQISEQMRIPEATVRRDVAKQKEPGYE